MRIPVASGLAIMALLGSLVVVQDGPTPATGPRSAPRPTTTDVDHSAIVQAYGKLPLSFEANRGQAGPGVDFLARGPGYRLSLSPVEAGLMLRTSPEVPESRDTMLREHGREVPEMSTVVLRMKIVGGAADAVGSGVEKLPGKVNSYIGADPAQWHTNIPTYAKIVYANVYPNVDLAYYGHQGQLEYDFVLNPGSDLDSIALRFDGAAQVELDADGNLVLRVGARSVTQTRPLAYQDLEGKRLPVPAGYRLVSDGTVRFDLGPHDRSVPVVIDPVLAYSTYLGGTGFDEGMSIAVDAFGNAYIAGDVTSVDFPTTPGAFQPALATPQDVFVSKLSLLGNTLIYSTYLGGSNDDVGRGIALDASGDAYVTGQTRSTNFPTTLAALQPGFAGAKDAFVTELNQQGNALVYSTYLGGGDEDGGLGITLGPSGSATVAGYTISTNFPVTLGAFQTASAGSADIFVARLNVLGTGLLYSTYIGGTAADTGTGVAVDSAGDAYVIGYTTSGNYPTSVGALQATNGGLFDAVVTKLNPLGSALVYSTYLGGSENDSGQGIALDTAGNAYLAGYSRSTDFPTTPGSFQTAIAGAYDVFVAKLNPLGNTLTYSTYIGGTIDDEANAIAIDASGSGYITGFTNSPDLPTVNAFQTAIAGGSDAFVTKLNPTGTALDYSSYLGGSIEEIGYGIAVDVAGDAYVAGRTGSADFPTTASAFQPASGGGGNAFVVKVGLLASTPLCSVTVNEGGWITASNGDMATFNGVVMTDAQNNLSGHESYKDHGPVQPIDVDSIELLATTCSDDRTTATIFGRATVDGTGDHVFRIDMVDGSQSWTNDRYGISLDNGYMSGLQPLGGGNIVIH